MNVHSHGYPTAESGNRRGSTIIIIRVLLKRLEDHSSTFAATIQRWMTIKRISKILERFKNIRNVVERNTFEDQLPCYAVGLPQWNLEGLSDVLDCFEQLRLLRV